MARYAEFSDVKNMFFPPLPGTQQQYVEALLDQASAAVRARVPSVVDRIAAGVLSEETVKLVTIRIVFRFLNSGGGGLKSETVGPFRREFASSDGSSGLDLTDGELATLTGVVSGSKIGQVNILPPIEVVSDDAYAI